MADKPIITHDFVPAVVNIREEDPSRFLGGPSLVIRSFKHEKDRIKVIILILPLLSSNLRIQLKNIMPIEKNTLIRNMCIIVRLLNSEEEILIKKSSL